MKQYVKSVAPIWVLVVYVLFFVTSHVTAQVPKRGESAQKPRRIKS
jgi:hypothetical protein